MSFTPCVRKKCANKNGLYACGRAKSYFEKANIIIQQAIPTIAIVFEKLNVLTFPNLQESKLTNTQNTMQPYITLKVGIPR